MADYLDPTLQKDLDELRALQLEHRRLLLQRGGAQPTEQLAAQNKPSQSFLGSLGSKLASAGWRGLELAGEFGHAAAKFPLALAKAPAQIEEFTTGSASPMTERLRQAARNVDVEIGKGVRFFGEQAGTPLQEMKTEVPVLGEVSAATPARAAGTFLWPMPAIKAVPKLFTKEAIQPVLGGMAKMGGFSGALQASEEMDRPPAERNWWHVPQAAATGALMTPLFQRGMGMLTRRPPEAAGSPGVTPPPGGPAPTPPEIRTRLPEKEELGLGFGQTPETFREMEPSLPPPPIRQEFMGQQIEARPATELPETEMMTGKPATTKMFGQDVELQKVGEPSFPESAPGLPKNPDFELTAQEAPRARVGQQPQQLGIDVPPATIGERPIIGREAQLEEAPLFSKAAQMPEPEQTVIPETRMSPGARILKDYVEQGQSTVPVDPKDAPILQAVMQRYGKFTATGAEPATVHEMLAQTSSPAELDVVRKYLNPVTPGETANPAVTPRHLLPPDMSDEMLRRAEKATADMEIAGTERGGRVFQEAQGQGSTMDVTGLKSPTADWYKEVTTGPKKLSMQRVERALEKIKQDQGADVGKDVQRVKEVLGRDPEFEWSPWGKPVEQGAPPLPEWAREGVEAEPRHVEHSVEAETKQNLAGFNHISNLLNDERGSINLSLGQGVGPIQKILTARRVAELHPQDFKPVYDHTQQRMEFVTAQRHDLYKLADEFFRLPEADRLAASKILSTRRRLQQPGIIPPKLQPAVAALDKMFASAEDLINSVREAKGLPPMQHEDFYVPFSRSGDYLVVMEGPKGTTPRWVSGAETLREAEGIAKDLQAKFPQGQITVKSSSGQKGDKPALDFGTMGMLRKAGLLGDAEYEQAIKQFGLPMGFSEHFQKALKIFGEATDLTDPISRYIEGITNYSGRALYDDTTKQLVSKIKDPQVRQYAEKYRQYINEKPVEFSRLRGATAVYDLALNVGSMVQNASQVPVMGLPVLQSHVGSVTKAANLLRKGFGDVLNPMKTVTVGSYSYKPADLIERWTRSGDVRPVNAQELFGVVKGEQTGVELGSPTIERMAERGALSPHTASLIRKPVDFLAGQFEKRYQQFQDVNQALGQKMSYGISRLTGKSPQEATQKAAQAHGILMQGFAWMEEKNRAMALLSGYRAGLEKGMNPQTAFEFARKFSRDVNFDYSPASRAQYFRGMGAPLGLFMTFQTEAIATYSKLLKAQMKQPGLQKLYGPATTAILAYMTLGGMKGLPGPLAGFPSLEDIDMYGPKPGAISERLPDWMWHGPASAISGVDVGSKFKLGARVPFRMGDQGPEFDPSQVAIAQPFYNLGKAATQLGRSPGDASDWWKFGESISPPAIRNPIAAARWAGFGPAGELERGAVGTIKGHTPGPGESGKREFFIPSPKDIAGKALTFTPLELSKQYARGRIESQYKEEEQGVTTETVNAAARHLQKNGPTVPNEALRKLVTEHPNTYRELMKAYGKWQREPHGSVEQIYRAMQEPKKPAKRE